MSGRQLGLVRKPPYAKPRGGGNEFGSDHFVGRGHDRRDEQPLEYWENLSPQHQMAAGSRQNREMEMPSDLPERRDGVSHVKRGRGEHVHSRLAPPIGRPEKRPYVDGVVTHMSSPPLEACQGYDYIEYEDYDDEMMRKPNHWYGYGGHARISRREYSDSRFLGDIEDGNIVKRQHSTSTRLHPSRGHEQIYGQSSQSYSTLEMQRLEELDGGHGQISESHSMMELRRSKEESDLYQQEIMFPENLYTERYYEYEDKRLYQPKISARPLSQSIQYEDTGNHYPPKVSLSTSSGVIRDDFRRGFHHDDPFDKYPRRSEKLSETLDMKDYVERPHIEARRDYEAGFVDMEGNQYDPDGRTWNEHEDYAYANVESKGEDDPGYVPRDVLYREDRAHARGVSEHRHMQRPSIAAPFAEMPTEAEASQKTNIDNGFGNFDDSQKESPVYADMRRSINTVQESDFLDTDYSPAEFSRKASRDIQFGKARVLDEHGTSAYDPRIYGNVSRTRGQSVKYSAEPIDPVDMQRHSRRDDRYADEQVADNRTFKRKFIQYKEGSGFSVVSREWKTKKINTASSGLNIKGPSGHESNLFLEAKEMMDEICHQKHPVGYGRSDQGKWKSMQENSVMPLEPGRKYMKVHSKPESSKGYGQSHYINHRNNHYKQHYDGKGGEDGTLIDAARQDSCLSGNRKGHVKYDLCEDSDDFKQSVTDAFLMFSKKLNENPPIRKLYQDRGKSGSLFCIVCGRSVSKVFQDTERLAKHTFMSHKPSLRAQHLGLRQAICVLMGWKIEVPVDTITWVPRALPQSEALAQKEDLILWQPTVIIHNISLSNTNHKEWNVVTLEALEDIIRAKSFIKSRTRICLGYPGDQSVMLVKFIGTFTGLQEAEKLHNYFLDNSRGRSNFKQAISNTGKSGSDQGAQGDSESLLYGYMGIAEDLDRVDFDTKKRCQIKSKKEIQCIVDAPLKAE